MADIKLDRVAKRFGEFVAVRSSSFQVNDGEFFVMLGPSGCGKTTTLRMIAGLELPGEGEIRLDGEDVTFNPASKRDIAFVFQLFALYPHMNVRKNIAFPLVSQGVARAQVRATVEETAKLLRIDHLLDARISALSTGDRQRVALGRAIVRRPKAFLMDEPLGALDAEFRDLMREELRLLHNRIDATTVYVTHDQIEAMSMADRIAVMNKAEVLQIGTPGEVYGKPASLFVANFIGSPAMNFLPASGPFEAGIECVQVDGAEIPVPRLREALAHDQAVLGVRPEHIEIVDRGPLEGRVFGVEYMGTRQLVTVDTHAGRIKVRAPNTVRVADGENVHLALHTANLVVFDGISERALDSELYGAVRNG
ncbi:MAG: ABC transporter ATP-binding protein [Gammaproteobacteria bacterium]